MNTWRVVLREQRVMRVEANDEDEAKYKATGGIGDQVDETYAVIECAEWSDEDDEQYD